MLTNNMTYNFNIIYIYIYMTFMYLKYCDLIWFKYLQLAAQSQATTKYPQRQFQKAT